MPNLELLTANKEWTIGSGGTVRTLTVSGDLIVTAGAHDLNIASHDGANGLKLAGTLVTASAAELNILHGVTSTTAELNFLNGITSALATQSYVDGVAQGLDIKGSVRVATTVPIDLINLQSIDGVALADGDRVLVKNQNNPINNGIYLVAVDGPWTRATDFDINSQVTGGAFTFIEEGSLYQDTGWVLSTNNSITIGATSLTFTQFSNAGVITTGTGLSKIGNEISIDPTVVTINGAGAIAGVFTGDITGNVIGNVTGNVSGTAATVTVAAQPAITSVGTELQIGNLNINGNTLSSTAGTDLLITPLAGQQIVLDGAIVIDDSVVTGATSITSTAFVGALTGDVTGNVSGTAATVTLAAQPAITSVGTELQIGNLNINGNTLSSTAGTDLLITPLAGQQIVLDGAIVIDDSVVTGATSITSTAFVGALTGDVTGNVSGTASKAAPIQSSFIFVPYTNLTSVLSQGTGEVFVAAGSAYNVTVTPTTATSKFFIQYKINYRCSWESDQRISFKITKTVSGDSEDTLLIRDNNLGLANAGGPFHGVWCSNYLDTVSTTTNVTYKLYYKLESPNLDHDFISGILGNDGTDDAVYNSIAIQEYIE